MSYILKSFALHNVSITPYSVHDMSVFNPTSGVIYPKQEFLPKLVLFLPCSPALKNTKLITDEEAEILFKAGGTFTVAERYDVWVQKMAVKIQNKDLGWKAVDLKRSGLEVTFKVKGSDSLIKVSCEKTMLGISATF